MILVGMEDDRQRLGGEKDRNLKTRKMTQKTRKDGDLKMKMDKTQRRIWM